MIGLDGCPQGRVAVAVVDGRNGRIDTASHLAGLDGGPDRLANSAVIGDDWRIGAAVAAAAASVVAGGGRSRSAVAATVALLAAVIDGAGTPLAGLRAGTE